MQRFTTLALMLAMASTAYADDPTEGYARRFMEYDHYRETLEHGGNIRPAPGDCTKDIAKAKVEGVPADAVFTIWLDGKKLQMSFDDVAAKICVPYERAYEISYLDKEITAANDLLKMATVYIDKSQTSTEHQKGFEEGAKKCFATADHADKLGIGDDEYTKDLHYDEIRAKICEPLAKAAGSWAADVKKATDERVAELAAPYKAVGIKGDKLQFCIDNALHNIYGVGGNSLEPAQIKKASVLFTLWQDSSSGVYSLQRHAFKGDRFVGQSERRFPRTPNPRAYK